MILVYYQSRSDDLLWSLILHKENRLRIYTQTEAKNIAQLNLLYFPNLENRATRVEIKCALSERRISNRIVLRHVRDYNSLFLHPPLGRIWYLGAIWSYNDHSKTFIFPKFQELSDLNRATGPSHPLVNCDR